MPFCCATSASFIFRCRWNPCDAAPERAFEHPVATHVHIHTFLFLGKGGARAIDKRKIQAGGGRAPPTPTNEFGQTRHSRRTREMSNPMRPPPLFGKFGNNASLSVARERLRGAAGSLLSGHRTTWWAQQCCHAVRGNRNRSDIRR